METLWLTPALLAFVDGRVKTLGEVSVRLSCLSHARKQKVLKIQDRNPRNWPKIVRHSVCGRFRDEQPSFRMGCTSIPRTRYVIVKLCLHHTQSLPNATGRKQ